MRDSETIDIEFSEWADNFIARQQRLPPEFEKVLFDNLWDLYD